MYNNFDITRNNSDIFSQSSRLIAKNSQELEYCPKQREPLISRIGNFFGVTKKSLHQVVKTANALSERKVQDVLDSSEEISSKLTTVGNIQSNLKQIEAIRERNSEKSVFKLAPPFFYCASTRVSSQWIDEKYTELTIQKNMKEEDVESFSSESSGDTDYKSLDS